MSEETSKTEDDGNDITLHKGRSRFCKQCKFQCTDPKEFLDHQKFAHSQDTDPDLIRSLGGRRRKSQPTKRAESRTNSITDLSIDHSISLATDRSPGKNTTNNIHEQNFKNKDIADKSMENNSDNMEDHNMDEPMGDIEDLANMNTDGDIDQYSNLSHEMEDDEGRLIIAEEDHIPGSIKTPTRSGNIQNRTYVCSQCDFSSTSAKTFLHHQKDAHNVDITIYECDICEYATKYKQKLPRHRKLHFSGKDNMLLLNGSDLDSSFSEKDNKSTTGSDIIKLTVPMHDDEEEEGEEEEEEEEAPVTMVIPEAPEEKKKRKTRQEVDPGKYFEVCDEAGIKYACSKCGNVYKWRKSLNKHWKEKHFGDIPDSSKPPPGLAKLNAVSNMKYRYPVPPSERNRLSTMNHSTGHSGSSTPVMHEKIEEMSISPVVMPRSIGPFISNAPTYYPQPKMAHHPRTSPDVGYRPHSTSMSRERSVDREDQPIDFSVNKEMNMSTPKQMDFNRNRLRYEHPMEQEMFQKYPEIKREPHWNENHNNDNGPISKEKEDNPVLQCNRCGFVAKTLVDYSSHMTLHLNKRAFKCAECQEHFNGVDDLNKHFAENHSEKIQEHKEAIQKIPHGLQQTYHLLKMPLNNIAAQEMSTTTEPKYLKCNMCNFVAKWPAELQKHAVSHSEERPFICMVCGSTYKWKWDLVKHFEKSHSSLQNPYKRREQNTPASAAKSATSTPSSSYVGMNNGMYSGALQILSSTAAALVDKDQFSKKRYSDDFHEEAPNRKQRRMSDTELHLLEDTNNNLSRDGYITAGAIDYQTNRASSEPPKNNDSFGDMNGQKSAMSTLKEMENMIPSSDESNQSGRDQYIRMKDGLTMKEADGTEILLPYKCRLCEYRARWPSEIQQHMKNHSDEKPYHCPRCSYKSKWKWDVVKHLKRCGGGTIKDVIDTTKVRKLPPPNVTVNQEGSFHEQTPQPFKHAQPGDRDMHDNATQKRFVYNGFMQNMTENEQNEKIVTYECMECPFVGNSPAELKRHSVLHSENKPFSCTVCGYSSRWKCDLKKHMRTYGHDNKFLPQSDGMSPMYLQDKFKLSHKVSDSNMPLLQPEDDRQLYECDQCQYATYKKLSYQAHLKMHGMNVSQEASDKFKCKQCNFKAPDLSTFLQHKKTHSTGSVASPSSQQNIPSPQQNAHSPQTKSEEESTPNNDMSSRTLNKHRRKPSQPVQQFKCSKCTFTSFSKSSIMMHENTHETEKMDDDNEGQEDEQYDDCKIVGEQEYQFEAPEGNQSPEKSLNLSGALDLTRTSTPVSIATQHKPIVSTPSLFSRTPNNSYRFHCEWCPAMFPNLATVYQHASQVHPNELKAQETNDQPIQQTGMSLPTRQPITPVSASNYEQPALPTKHQLPQLQAQLQQNPMFGSLFKYRPIEPKPSSAPVNTTSSIASMPSTVSALTQSLQQRLDNRVQTAVAMQLQQQAMARAKKSTSPQKRGRSFQCTKCSFTAPNAVTYLRHIERHGSNCRHTCRFCDYSIDRLNLLYQHMKGTHGDVWRGTPEEKIRLTPSGKEEKRWMMMNPDNESLNSSFDGSDYGQDVDLQEQLEESANREMKIYSTMAINGQKPVLVIGGMANWRGIPIQLCMINGRKNYKCASCAYVSSNAANTGNHARQHNCGKKYSCEICSYGADNPKLIANHKDSIHTPEPIFIEKYENTPFTEYEGSLDENGMPTGNKGPMILPTCTKCPFKCRTVKKLQKHLLLHGSGEKNKCEYCDFHVATMEELLQHLVVHREPYEPKLESSDEEDNARSVEQKGRQNEQPILTQEKMNNILNKLSNNAGQIRYKCSRCAFTAYRKSSLFSHMEHHLKQPNLADQYVHRNNFEDMANDQAEKYFQTVIIDPKDERGLDILKNANTSEFSDHDMEEDKEFMDESEYMDDIETLEGCELGEEEMVQLEQEGFEGSDIPKFGQKSFNGEDSDDSLSEMDPIALQQQMSMNLSGKLYGDKIRYTCQQCPYRCNALRSFKCHIHMHGLNKKYICDYCNWSADRLNLLYQHRKVHQSEVDFNPAPEDIVFLNRDFALENNKRGNEIVVKSTMEDKMISRMVNKTHDGKKLFICKLCPFSCTNRNSYTYHKSLHKISARFTCNECSFSVDRSNLLSQHMRLHKRDVTESPSSEMGEYKNYEPTTPEFAPQLYFNSQDSVNDSDVSEEEDYRELKCDRCPYSTPSKEELNIHEYQHNKRSENTCPYCDFSCQKEEQLVGHLQFHFPSTKIDSETFKSIIEKQGKHSEKMKPEVPVVRKIVRNEHGGEPDSTSASNAQNIAGEQKGQPETLDTKSKSEKTFTKIYVCQYCEREFEGKSLLLQHEKQHMIGN